MKQLPRLIRLILKTLPKDFRERHQEEMTHLFATYASERIWLVRWSFWLRAALDTVWVALALRLRAPKRSEVGRLRTNLDTAAQDFRLGLRSLSRNAPLTALVTLIVGVGVGSASVVFSVADVLFLRPLPFEDSQQLVWISNGEWRGIAPNQQLSERSVQVSHLMELRSESTSLSDVVGYSQFDRPESHMLTSAESPMRVTRLSVTENFFSLMGIRAQIGRSFAADESMWGGPAAIMLTHRFWAQRFESNPDIVGQSVGIDGTPHLVVGVLPEAFELEEVLSLPGPIHYVRPFPLGPETDRRGNSLALIGRLNPGVTVQTAEREALDIVARNHSDSRNAFVPVISPLRERVSGRYRAAVSLLLGGVALVMLIVCANLSNLLLIRGLNRKREIAIRAALGAGRARLVRQMLTESLLLAGAGAGLGLVLAVLGTRQLQRLNVDIPLLSSIQVDESVLGFALVLTIATGLLFGILPALRISALSPQKTLRQSGRSASDGRDNVRIRRGLVISEIALATVLLTGAGLLTRSFVEVIRLDLGYEPENTVLLRLDPGVRFSSFQERISYHSEALARVRAAPGVASAGLTDVLPMSFNRRWCIKVPGSPIEGVDCAVVAPYVRVISDGYLEAMGLHLESGRDLTDSDRTGARRVVLINDVLAAIYWPDQDPVGEILTASDTPWEVVGVVKGMRYLDVEEDPGPELFFPMWQNGDASSVHLVARGSGSLRDLTAGVVGALGPFDQRLPLTGFNVMREIVDRSLSARRFLLILVGGFAGFSLLLAALGIFGIISYSVGQKRREFGIRMAFGASPLKLRNGVLSETFAMVLSGLAVGLVLSWVLGRVIGSLLYGVSGSDPATFLIVSLVLAIVAFFASYLPARRTTRMDPAETLCREG